jgi:hypothetical protein
MKKLISILALSLLFSGTGYAKTINFSKCYTIKEGNLKFSDKIFEQNSFVIDFNKGIVESIMIYTDNHFKDLSEKNPLMGLSKYYIFQNKITSYNEFIILSKVTLGKEFNKFTSEKIWDLKTKKVQYKTDWHHPDRRDTNLLIQCE